MPSPARASSRRLWRTVPNSGTTWLMSGAPMSLATPRGKSLSLAASTVFSSSLTGAAGGYSPSTGKARTPRTSFRRNTCTKTAVAGLRLIELGCHLPFGICQARYNIPFGNGFNSINSERCSMQRIFVLALLFPFMSFICAHGADKKAKIVQPAELSDHDRALHALERLTFGPRPGDLERVLSVGLSQWIDQQLNPASISNSLLDSRLAQYRTLRMQPRELAQAFPTGQMIREAAEKKRPMPSDPVQYGLWEVLVDKYNEQQKASGSAQGAIDDSAQKAAEDARKDAAAHLADMLLALPKN